MFDFPGRRFEGLGAAGNQTEPGAPPRECLCGGTSNASGRAGDNDSLRLHGT
jgi:hypothetical protein